LTPTDIQAHRVTTIGCANIEPRHGEHTLLFVQKFGRKVMEYFPDVFSGKFSAPNLSWRAKHLTSSGIAEIAYQQELSPMVWARTNGGDLIGCLYKRDTLTTSQPPNLYGWHQHKLGSFSVIESISVAGNADGTLDALAVVSREVVNGITVRFIEIMSDQVEEGETPGFASYLDSSISSVAPTPIGTTFVLHTVSSTEGTMQAPYGGMTINGLWLLNGRTVSVFAGGLDCGDFAVSNGAVFVPFGDGISGGTAGGQFTATTPGPVIAGSTYTSRGQGVRPATAVESGARDGPGFGKFRRTHMASLLVENTAGLSIGTDFAHLRPVLFKDAIGAAQGPGQAFSGMYWDTLDDDYSLDSMLCWQVTRPLPCNMMAIGGHIHTQDR
jgi:hypothetical protein